jgi:hypothetical protein
MVDLLPSSQFQYNSPLDWLKDKLAKVEDDKLLTYLNPMIGNSTAIS